MVGVKEASGNISQIAAIFQQLPERFAVLSGDDAITLPVIALGGVGVISVVSNEVPYAMSRLTAHPRLPTLRAGGQLPLTRLQLGDVLPQTVLPRLQVGQHRATPRSTCWPKSCVAATTRSARSPGA